MSGIARVRPLERQPFIVAALVSVRVAATHMRSRRVYAALTGFLIEQGAHRLVDRVLAVAENLLGLPTACVRVRVALSSGLSGHTEVICQSPDVRIRHSDGCVAATIAGAPLTFELH
jgi:hypothetical protein